MVVFKNKQDQDKKEFEAHKKELEQARDFQLSLIPDNPPKDIAYDVHSYMKTSMEVGGDYYDYFKNDNDLFIGYWHLHILSIISGFIRFPHVHCL